MKKQVSVLLSGVGYYRLSEQRRKTLFLVLGISLLLHVVGLAIFGGYTLAQYFREEKTVFVAPPPTKTYKPKLLEHRVKVQKRQRSSSRPSMTPRLVSMKTSSFALPEITTKSKAIKTSFQPKFKAVSGIGIGVGLGTGYGLGGFGSGVSAFNFFGIQGRGDKIAILVDVSTSMIEPERGGPKGFEKVKSRLGEVVDALNHKAMFNVIAFADAARTMKPTMQIASKDNKAAAKQFIEPYNTNNSYGLSSGNVNASNIGLAAGGGTTRLDLALTAAFEQGADTILVISDGLPRVVKGYTAEERAAHGRRLTQWRDANKGALETYNRAAASAEYTTSKVWVPPRAASTGPPREGQAQHGAREGHWKTVRRPNNPLPSKPSPPGLPTRYWTLGDFFKHFEILHKEYYEKKGRKLPVAHGIGYGIDDAGGRFLRDFVKRYKGRYRKVGKLKK